MFELLLYTLFFLVFPTAQDGILLPNDAAQWHYRIVPLHADVSRSRSALDALLYRECETEPYLCALEHAQ